MAASNLVVLGDTEKPKQKYRHFSETLQTREFLKKTYSIREQPYFEKTTCTKQEASTPSLIKQTSLAVAKAYGEQPTVTDFSQQKNGEGNGS